MNVLMRKYTSSNTLHIIFIFQISNTGTINKVLSGKEITIVVKVTPANKPVALELIQNKGN